MVASAIIGLKSKGVIYAKRNQEINILGRGNRVRCLANSVSRGDM